MKINSAKELREYFNKEYGITKPWPKTFHVNSECYADCCQEAFNWYAKNCESTISGDKWNSYRIMIGNETNGLMFKNVELILDRK